MGYYGRHKFRVSRWSNWTRKPTKTDRLTNRFGDAVGQIRNGFLALDPPQLDALLKHYGQDFGVQAENYARQAYPGWKSGKTGLSGQILERLIALVPPHLSAATRFGLLQEILKKQPSSSRGKSNKNLRISTREPGPGFAELDAALNLMYLEDSLAHVSESVMNAAKWLYDDDMTAARAILAEFSSRTNETIKASAAREIDLLRRTVHTGQVKEAHYNVHMPAGNLTVEVFTPSRTLRELLFG